MPEMIDEKSHTESTTIGVYRTASTVKGGRRFSFGALVVVGNRDGEVGFGYAKSNEVPQAIEKSQKYASRQKFRIERIGTTIHHQVDGKFGSSTVRLIPASPGTGVVAGTVVRAVLELAGIQDCLTKCYGSTNPQNILKAAFDALRQLRTPGTVQSLRGLDLGQTEIQIKIEKGKQFMPTIAKSDKPKGPVNTIGNDRRGGPGGRGPRRGRQQAAATGEAPAPTDSGAAPANG